MEENKKNIENVLDKIKMSLSEKVYKKFENFKILKTIHRPYSTITFFEIEVSGNIIFFVSKTIAHHPLNKSIIDSENQAVVEYTILKNLFDKFASIQNCGVPKPVLVLPEIESYVMEHVPGKILQDYHKYFRYFAPIDGINHIEKYYFYYGQWLKHFQIFTGYKFSGLESLQGVTNRCDERLKLIEEFNNKYAELNLRNRVMNLMQKYISYLNGSEILISGRHGDFGPWNAIASAEKIIVIDFLGYKKESVAVDLVKILVYLEDEKKSIATNRKSVNRIIKSFLKGYGDIPEIQSEVFLICEIMQRVVSLWGNISNPKGKKHHILESKIRINNHIKWLLEENNTSLLYQYIS